MSCGEEKKRWAKLFNSCSDEFESGHQAGKN